MESKRRLVYNLIIALIFVGGVIFGSYFFRSKQGDNLNLSNNESLEISGDELNNGNDAGIEGQDGQIFALMKTNFGDIKLELFPADAPKTVDNFIKLSESDFYDGVKFHRVIKDFMIQSGDPNSKDDNWSDDGTGGPGYSFDDEINEHKIVKGTLAMANSGPNTNGSQFFIVTADETPWLDGKHTVFGKVVEGMNVVLEIENTETDTSRGDHPINDVVIEDIEIIKN